MRRRVEPVAGRDLLVGRLPAVGRRRVRWVEGDGRRAHRARSSKRISTASRWACRPSASASVAIVARIEASPSRSIRWTWTNLPYASTDRPPEARARPPVGQHVVRAGRVVAGRLGRPRADEQRARVAQPVDRRLERLDVDREVLGGVGVDEVDGGVERRRERDQAVVAERGGEDVPAGRPLELVHDGGLDGVGEGRVGGDQDRRRIRAVLGLGDEVGGDASGIGRRRGEDHPLRRPGREVDADLAADLDLGGGDPGVARPDDPVDRREARVGQAERERADRLGAAGDDEGVDLEQPGRARGGPGFVRPSRSAGDATTT